MRDADGSLVRPVSRVKGRGNLERSLRRLLIRVHRFAQHRAATAEDITWCARTIDQLTATLGSHEHEDTREPETRA